uniref:Ig-like domain-containing protein n=1 Tax=Cyprinus carpio TaxID=7962 RepID=A0A8C2I1X4_CYPCA
MIEECVMCVLLCVSVSQTEISAGLSVTLFCQLYSFPRVSCDDWIRSERIQLFWVNQTGVKLNISDSRYQISSSSDHCIITLNTTLLNEDDNREWRCEVTQRDQVKTSVTYTVKSSGEKTSSSITSFSLTDEKLKALLQTNDQQSRNCCRERRK